MQSFSPEDALPILRLAMGIGGAASALLLFSLVVWTARDIAARSRDSWQRIGAIALVLALNLFGLVIYLLLRPRETLAERYEREMIEELLARELAASSMEQRAQRRPVAGPTNPNPNPNPSGLGGSA